MTILKDIAELIKAGIISQETADKIQKYYKSKNEESNNSKLFIVFGVLGAILVGLGVILIISHNWDELSRATKTLFAFLPLVIGQILGVFVMLKKSKSTAWREGVAAFIFFAVGASIAMVSQIYNIPGDLKDFMLTWMLLCLPLVYVMKSSIASLLYIAGITFYASHVGYWSYPYIESYTYWILLLAILPYYYLLYKKSLQSNFMSFHNWLVPLSITIALGTVADSTEILLPIAYSSLFGLFYLVGKLPFLETQKLRNNGYIIIGSLGSVILLLILSFNDFWKELRSEKLQFSEVITTPEFIATSIIVLLASVLLYKNWNKQPMKDINPIGGLFLVFILIYVIGIVSPISVVLVNLLLFATGILIIREGAKKNHLGILNYGLLIITALVISRFFDTDISFIIRGILFIGVGIGFFATNYWMLKKRKTNEK